MEKAIITGTFLDGVASDQIAKIHEIDGYHPKCVVYSSWIPKGEEFTDWCDILGTDPYWVPGGEAECGVRGTINYVSKIT